MALHIIAVKNTTLVWFLYIALSAVCYAYSATSSLDWTSHIAAANQALQCCRPACCRVGERLVLGDANVSTMGAGDLNAANRCAREMVYRCGFSAKLGPVSLMDQEEVYLGQGDRCSLSRGYITY